MILAVSSLQALSAGCTALLGPSMPLVFGALATGAAVAGSRRASSRSLWVMGAVFTLAVVAVWARADLVPPARFSRWLPLLPLLGLVEIRRLHIDTEDWMAPAAGLCTAALVLFWRVDRYGPTLAALRGDWQQPLSFAPRGLYHLGTGICLAAVMVGLALVVRRLPARVQVSSAWALLGVTIVLVVFDLIAPVQQWLLLHALPWRVG